MTLIKLILFILPSYYILDRYGYSGCCNKIKINWKNIAIIAPILSILAYLISLL